MNKEEKKCKGCSCWCSCYDEDGDQTPKYCDACGGYYRERAEELRAEVERLEYVCSEKNKIIDFIEEDRQAKQAEIERLRDEVAYTNMAVFDAVSYYSSEDCGRGRGVDFIEEAKRDFYLLKKAKAEGGEG